METKTEPMMPEARPARLGQARVARATGQGRPDTVPGAQPARPGQARAARAAESLFGPPPPPHQDGVLAHQKPFSNDSYTNQLDFSFFLHLGSGKYYSTYSARGP